MYLLFTYGQRRVGCNFITPIGMENFFQMELLCEEIGYNEEYFLDHKDAKTEVAHMDNYSDRLVFDLRYKN